MYCPSCGKSVKENNNFCTYCGGEILSSPYSETKTTFDTYNSPKAKMAIVFAILGLILSSSPFWILGFFCVPALIISLGELKKFPDDQKLVAAKIMSLAGIAIMVLGLISIIILKSKGNFHL